MPPRKGTATGLRPLSARSVVLSLLLGTHPPELPVRDLIRSVERFGVTEPTLRVALSRMVGAGDLHRTDATYRLSDRLLERQRRQDDAIHPRTRAWRGDWEIAVITVTGRGPAERAELRADLSRLRLAELREGVWLRPANLQRPWPDRVGALVQRFTARPDQPPHMLASTLWALDDWADTTRSLLDHFTNATLPADRLAAAAAMVRHMVTDPILPADLLPARWPGPDLRATYADYQREMNEVARTGSGSGSGATQ
jgi:phenylacetic acid degradation operon negative regulatory protein